MDAKTHGYAGETPGHGTTFFLQRRIPVISKISCSMSSFFFDFLISCCSQPSPCINLNLIRRNTTLSLRLPRANL
jgi:hypothetical protein